MGFPPRELLMVFRGREVWLLVSVPLPTLGVPRRCLQRLCGILCVMLRRINAFALVFGDCLIVVIVDIDNVLCDRKARWM